MILNALKHLIKDDRGGTAIEYGLMIALLALAAMVAMRGFASETLTMFENVNSKVEEVTNR